MALADYQPERVEIAVSVSGGGFSVRAVGVGDLTLLFRAFLQDVETLASIIRNRVDGRQLSAVDGALIAMDLIQRAPELVAGLIAIASDEPGATEQAGKLPLHAQVAALAAIGRLTFRDVDGLGNTLATLLQAAGAAVPATAPPI